MAIKYIVELGWRDKYSFDDGQTAKTFAELALTHKIKEDSDDKREVSITVVEEE